MDYNYFMRNEEEVAPDVFVEHRIRLRHQVQVRHQLRKTQNPFAMSVTEFVKLYRMPQHQFQQLVEIIRPYVPRRTHKAAVSLEAKCLCAVGFYASGNYQRYLGRMADLNVSQAQVSNILMEVTSALNHEEILTRFIHFPDTPEEREACIAINDRLGMPRTLGFIDGTLVGIVPPPRAMNKQAYYCRKGFPALNVQVVCDASLKILDVNARFPGSCNDPFIYRASGVREVMTTAYQESRCWLLGDSIYPLEPWLQLPLPHAERGTPEYSYTKLHCSCRNAVERCIGVLKARWRCLLRDRVLHYLPAKAGLIVNACAVLHNFCLSVNAPQPAPIFENQGIEDLPEELDPEEAPLRALAEAERQILIEYAHANRRQYN